MKNENGAAQQGVDNSQWIDYSEYRKRELQLEVDRASQNPLAPFTSQFTKSVYMASVRSRNGRRPSNMRG